MYMYIAHVQLCINALYIRALVIRPITLLLSFSALRGVYSIKRHAYSYTISTSTITGTHLYPWVKRSNYSEVSCSISQSVMTQTSNPHPAYLKTLDTIGNFQRLVFTNLWKFELNRSSKLRDIIERKKHPCGTMVTPSCVRLDAWFRDLKF